MGVNHDHHHNDTLDSNDFSRNKRLTMVLVLAASYMLLEILGGLMTGSLALLADAGHMLSDVAALALTLFALWIAQKPPAGRHTYGYLRSEILAALINGGTLVAIAIFIFFEAYQRLQEPTPVQGPVMLAIATGGLTVNLIGLWILNGDKEGSINVRGAWLHVLGDALGSVGAMLAGALIWYTGKTWIDPLVSVLIGLLIIYSSWSLMKEVVGVLMESAPGSIDIDAVRNEMISVEGLEAVHDLHVWTITSGRVALSAHVIVTKMEESERILAALRQKLDTAFSIRHTTIQIEPDGFEKSEIGNC